MKIMQCKMNWDFLPQKKWPKALPPLAWQEHLLGGFDRTDGQAIMLQGSLAEALAACYDRLSFAELSRFWQLANSEVNEGWEEIFATFGFRFDRNCEKTMTALLKTPRAFQFWAQEKQLAVKDLAILRALPDEFDIGEICLFIAEKSPSKSTGQQILELAVEVQLSGGELPSPEKSPEQWQRELYRRRYQRAAVADSTGEERVRQLPWPLHAKTKWLRQGDRSGLQLQFYATNQSELEKQLKGLEKICSLVKENPQLLWKN